MQQQTLFYHLSYVDENNERQIFYIGRTGLGLAKRLAQHKSIARRKKTTNGQYIVALELQGFTIEITEIYSVNTHERKTVEVIEDRLIQEYLNQGWELTNRGTGGFGLVPGQCRKNVVWTQEMEQQLGILSDYEISKRFHITRYAAMKRRLEKGLQPKTLKTESIEWTSEADALLGTMSDSCVAERLNITHTMVWRRRDVLGIPAYKPENQWNEIDPLLGTMIDKIIAQRFGVPISKIARRRQILNIPPYSR